MKLFTINSKNERGTIFIMESDSVSTLKAEIKKKYKITSEIEIFFNGAILEDDQQIVSIPLTEGETIQFNEIYKAGK